MNFREPSRPFDPTAMALHNIIIQEHRPVAEQNRKIFIPSHGPYYSDTLTVYSGGRLLVRGEHYRTLIHHPRATKKTGKEVSVCVQVIDSSLTDIDITYQCVGGQFQNLFEIVKLVKESHGRDILRTILWHEIVGKPTTFNPAAHWHVVWDMKGWEALVTPLDKIRNAIIFKKQASLRALYDYYYAKSVEHSSDLDARIEILRNKVLDLWTRIRPPVGIIGFYKSAQNGWTDGEYVELKNTLLYGVGADGDLGKTWNASKDLVFQYPDNLLLNEHTKPLMYEDDEYIYLDNEHPVSAAPVGEPYWEEIDELFDALCVKIYAKVSNGGDFDAKLTTDTNFINENEIALVQLKTVGFPTGTAVPYIITGVGPSNVSVPLTGTVAINSVGVATLAIRLIPGSPRTDLDKMEVEMMVLGGLRLNIGYNLLSNAVQKTETTIHQYNNGPLLETPIVRGDIYSLEITHRAVNNQKLWMTVTGMDGNDRITVGDNTYTGGTEIDINVPAEGNKLVLRFSISSRNVANGQIAISLRTPNGTTETINANLVSFAFNELVCYSPETGNVLTSVGYNQQFRLRVKQNSKDNPVVDLQFRGNNTTGQLLPDYIPPLYCKPNGVGESGTYVLMPTSGVDPIAGTLVFAVHDNPTGLELTTALQVTL